MEHTGRPSLLKRRRWLVTTAACVLILLCGMVIGGGLTLHFLWSRVVFAVQHLDEAPARVLERMDDRLGLSDEQTARIREVLDRRFKAITDIRTEFQPRLEAELGGARAEINAVLTPEQAELWNRRFDWLHSSLLPPLREEGK